MESGNRGRPETMEDDSLDYETLKVGLFSLDDTANHCRPIPEFTKKDIRRLVGARLKHFENAQEKQRREEQRQDENYIPDVHPEFGLPILECQRALEVLNGQRGRDDSLMQVTYAISDEVLSEAVAKVEQRRRSRIGQNEARYEAEKRMQRYQETADSLVDFVTQNVGEWKNQEMQVSSEAPLWVEEVLKKHRLYKATGTVTTDGEDVYFNGQLVGNRGEVE